MGQAVEEIVASFKPIVADKLDCFRHQILASGRGVDHMMEHYFDYFVPLQRISQAIVDEQSQRMGRDELFALARSLQHMIEDGAMELKTQLGSL